MWEIWLVDELRRIERLYGRYSLREAALEEMRRIHETLKGAAIQADYDEKQGEMRVMSPLEGVITLTVVKKGELQ